MKKAHLKGEDEFKPSPYLLALPPENRKFPPQMDPAQVVAAWDAAVGQIDMKQPMYAKSIRQYKEDTRPPSEDLKPKSHLFTYLTPPDPKADEAKRMLEAHTAKIKAAAARAGADITDEEAKARSEIAAAAEKRQVMQGYHHL